MQIGYMRVSKADGSQTVDLQKEDALVAAGIKSEHLYEDLASGRRDDRPGLAACLKALCQGDILVVWKLDRLGRDPRHLVNTVHDLVERGTGFRVLTGHGSSIDTTTASGKLVFGIFAILAEFERELISERTRAGLASARARGRQEVQDDGREGASSSNRHGKSGRQGQRAVRRTPDHAPDALSLRRAERRIAQDALRLLGSDPRQPPIKQKEEETA